MENMTLSKEPISEGQIVKLNQNITARLLKHRNEIPSDVFQKVLGDSTLVDEIYASIRTRVNAISDLVVRTVKVNRNRSPKEVLEATDRFQYVVESVFAEMPKGKEIAVKTQVFFFRLGRTISNDDLEKEYELRGLKPADLYSLAKVHEDDLKFSDKYPNVTNWKDSDGKWCSAKFDRDDDNHLSVSIYRQDHGWAEEWWFAGVRK